MISYTVFTKTLQPAFICKVLEYIDNHNYPKILYDNEYASFIDIYFYEYFHLALTLQTFLDTLSDILDKCLPFSLIKIEPVSSFPSQATLGTFFSICHIYFSIKMRSLVLIKNWYLFVFLIVILSNKLDFNQETHFTIILYSY